MGEVVSLNICNPSRLDLFLALASSPTTGVQTSRLVFLGTWLAEDMLLLKRGNRNIFMLALATELICRLSNLIGIES